MVFRGFRPVALLGVFGSVVVGCGGSGSAGSPAGVSADFGSVSARSLTAVPPPVIMGSRNAVFTGVSGAAFTDIRVRFPSPTTMKVNDVLAQTLIAVDRSGVPWLYDYGTGELTEVGQIQPWGNSCTPSISGQGTRIATMQADPGTASFNIYTSWLDGTGRIQNTTGTTWATNPAFSPDGSKIAFVRNDAAAPYSPRIWIVSGGGGAATAITPATEDCRAPAWTPDGRIGFYRKTSGATYWTPSLMNADGTSVNALPSGWTGLPPFSLSFASDMSFFCQTYYDGTRYWFGRSIMAGSGSATSTADPLYSVSVAPAGKVAVIQRGGAAPGIYLKNVEDFTETLLISGSYNSPSWGPYMSTRSLVGVSGAMSTSAAGFVFGQLGNGVVKSFVAFDATTRSTLTITPQANANQYQSLAVCTVSADSLTSLKFVNDLRYPVQTIIVPSAPATGAVLSFSADTGNLVSIAPYVGSVAFSNGIYQGKFLGVYDGKGKNQAVSGASSVRLDQTTGALSVQKL